MSGFTAVEEMRGVHELRDAPGRRPFAFRVRWGPERLRDWLDPRGPGFLWQELDGECVADGLFGWSPCRGTLHLDYLGAGRIRYVFDVDAGGRVLRYVGDKVHIRPWNLPFSHTTCVGTLTDLATGVLLSTSVVRFPLRDLPWLLASVRGRRPAS